MVERNFRAHKTARIRAMTESRPLVGRIRSILLASVVTLNIGIVAFGQTNLATISGLVKDPQGAIVPHAAVTATNEATAVPTKTVTDDAGFFSIHNLPVGNYSVTVAASGFKGYTRQGIVLTTGQSLGLEIQLEIGAVSQTVQVTGAASLVQTETSDISQTTTGNSVVALPLANRRPLQLVEITGAAVMVQYSNIIGQGVPDFSIGGGRTESQMAWLDGADVQNMRMGVGQIDLDPSGEALQEVKVLTNNYSAQYGGSNGGVIIETTKSGSNQFHGVAYEFLRNDALDAPGFFAPIQDGKKLNPELRFNLFGGTLGGPIRHDKTFFFVSYEGGRLLQGYTSTLTVPTAAQRGGDFSQTYNAAGKVIPIYDPSSTQLVNGAYVRTQFPNNVIPTGSLDPVAVKLMNFFPVPNQASSSITGANNFSGNYIEGQSSEFVLSKIDHEFSDRDRVSAWNIYNPSTPHYTSVYPNPVADTNTSNFNYVVMDYSYASWLHTFSPTKVNDFSVTSTYRSAVAWSLAMGGNPGLIGLTGVPATAFPTFTIGGFASLGPSQDARYQSPIESQSYVDNFTWISGRHSITFGGQWTRSLNDDHLLTSASGAFTFATQPTGLPGNSATGNALASLLVGFPESFTESETEQMDRREDYYALFAQDDWTVKPTLTLNLGLRWETDTPITDVRNHMNSFDPTEINPVSGTPGVVKFMGVGGWPTEPYGTRWDNLGPRFGFAWRPFNAEKTVIRGGVGVFFGHPFDAGQPYSANNGFSTSASLSTPNNGITAPFYLQNGVPAGAVATPVLNDSYGAVAVGQAATTAISFFEPTRKTGTSYQFNLGVQREIASNMLISVSFIGNESRHLPSTNMPIDQIPPSVLGPSCDTQACRPFPQFNGVSLIVPPLGVANYFAGVAHFQKRFSHGLTLEASYTWSSFLDNTDEAGATLGNDNGPYSNYYNRSADYGKSANDIPQSLIFDWIYELPFGPGKRWLGSSPARYVVEGWTIGNVATIRSGPPFTAITNTNNTDAFSAGSQRPNVLANVNLPSGQRSVAKWFNTAAFAQPATFQFGDEGVGTLQAPGLVNFDFSLLRDFRLTERVKLEFRGEFFNTFNRTNLGVPNATYGAANFGTISSTGYNTARVGQVGARITF